MGMAFRGTKATFLTVGMSGILLKVLFIASLAYILTVTLLRKKFALFLREASIFWRFYDSQTFYASIDCIIVQPFRADVMCYYGRKPFTGAGI